VRFWAQVIDDEDQLVDAARMAGHRRAHDQGIADFFVVQSNDLVDAGDGALVAGYAPGEIAPGPSPRFEFQVLPRPVTRGDVGQFQAVIQTVDGQGRVTSISFGNAEFRDSFEQFLLHVGDAGRDDLEEADRSRGTVPDAVEEFLTRWALASEGLQLDSETRRIADALVAMVGELAKTEDPPREVLRAAFRWFARKFERFTDEFVGSAGKAFGASFGAAAGVGGGAAVTGHLPLLVNAVEKVLRVLN